MRDVLSGVTARMHLAAAATDCVRRTLKNTITLRKVNIRILYGPRRFTFRLELRLRHMPISKKCVINRQNRIICH